MRGGGGSGDPLSDLDSVAWGGERFVAGGYWQDTILHSRDGEVWQEASGKLDGLMDFVWDGSRIVAVGSTIAHSADGDRWQSVAPTVDGEFHAVAWNGERYVAVGHAGLIMYSDDGDRWGRAVDSATEETLDDVAWNGERFVAVGFHGAIVHSRDSLGRAFPECRSLQAASKWIWSICSGGEAGSSPLKSSQKRRLFKEARSCSMPLAPSSVHIIPLCFIRAATTFLHAVSSASAG